MSEPSEQTISDPDLQAWVIEAQRNEITEYHIYNKLADVIKDSDNAKVLRRIAEDEKRHYGFWGKFSGKEPSPKRGKVFFLFWVARIFGLTFGIKLMERGEEGAQESYTALEEKLPGAKRISDEEEEHENRLMAMIEEERLEYVGSVVLGLNDALVELTGALAGLTFALQNTRLIALAGLITGIAASFSMAASEYLSKRSEGDNKRALPSAMYTGIAYIFTVVALILPYLLVANYFLCLVMTLSVAVLIIFVFNYYISVAKDLSFWKRFGEMTAISLGVALLSFGIGFVIRQFLGVEV